MYKKRNKTKHKAKILMFIIYLITKFNIRHIIINSKVKNIKNHKTPKIKITNLAKKNTYNQMVNNPKYKVYKKYDF